MKEESGSTMKNTTSLSHNIKTNMIRIKLWKINGRIKINQGENQKTKNTTSQKSYSPKKSQESMGRWRKKQGNKDTYKIVDREGNLSHKAHEEANLSSGDS